LEGFQQPKKWPKYPGNALSDALLMSRFEKFVADAAKYPGNALSDALLMSRFEKFVADAEKQNALRAVFETALRAVLINSLCRINSGPKILGICLLHWINKT